MHACLYRVDYPVQDAATTGPEADMHLKQLTKLNGHLRLMLTCRLLCSVLSLQEATIGAVQIA
jgi:hypothetical protein